MLKMNDWMDQWNNKYIHCIVFNINDKIKYHWIYNLIKKHTYK